MSACLHRQDPRLQRWSSLLMMRTRSAARCRGIYRLRDTSRERGGRRRGRVKRGLVLSSESFPRGGTSRNDGGRGQRRRWGGGVFLRAGHSPPGLRSFLIRRVVIRKKGRTPFSPSRSARQSLCFRRIKDVAGVRLSRGPQSIVNARLKNSWIRSLARSRDDVDGVPALFSKRFAR